MNFNFDKNTSDLLKILSKIASNQKKEIFFVGGIVRDAILNKPIKDIDIMIEGNAIDFAKSLPDEIKIKSIHKDFCTAKIEYKNINIDIASTRTEKYTGSGSLPEIIKIGVDVKEDVKRRDFTVNALCCKIKYNRNLEYELIDYVDGVNDIKNKKLKVLHPKSYIDDPTRIIRGIAFKYRFGFDFSSSDKELIDEYFKTINRKNLSIDRTAGVFKYAFLNEFSDKIFKEIIQNKIYKIINDYELNVDFDNINKAFEIIKLNKYQKAEFYAKIIENKPVEFKNNSLYIDINNTFSKYSNVDLAYYFYKTQDENVKIYNKIKKIELFISGNDLIKMNYPKGKLYGEILDNLLDKKMKNESKFQSLEDEINWVKSNYPLS